MPGRYDDEDEDTLAARLAKRAGASRPSESRSELSELLDMLGRRVSGAILFAGVAIGIGLFAGGGGDVDVEAPDYQAFAADGEVFRLNTDSGTLIACSATAPCRIILQRNQDLAEDQTGTLFKNAPGAQLPATAPAPAPQQTLPAPAAQPQPATTK